MQVNSAIIFPDSNLYQKSKKIGFLIMPPLNLCIELEIFVRLRKEWGGRGEGAVWRLSESLI